MTWACTNVIKKIESLRAELNLEPLVLRCPDKGIKVLQDNEAIYLNACHAGLKKHKTKTRMLFTHVNAENLNDHGAAGMSSVDRRCCSSWGSHGSAELPAQRLAAT